MKNWETHVSGLLSIQKVSNIPFSLIPFQHKLYYQIKVKINLQYNILIQKKVTFTQNNWKANRAE